MAKFSRKDRQAVIDDYLNDSRRNQFIPAEFLEWLSERPDHEVYDLFFGMDDEDAARAHRVDMVRTWTSGLRITVRVAAPEARNVGSVQVREYTLPAMISPVGGRKSGGGYLAVDPDNPDHMLEIYRQAATDLAKWIERYEGAMSMRGIALSSIKEIVAELKAAGDVVEAA